MRAKMAKEAINEKKLTIRQACKAFNISEHCFRYKPKLADDNAKIAELLLGLTQAQRNWGFGLCFYFGVMSKVIHGIASVYTTFTGNLS